MMFKTITHLMFGIALVFWLVGCDSSTESDDADSTRENQETSAENNDNRINTVSTDTTAPVITITGDNPLKITQGETFSDPGATATDNRDGTVAVIPTGTVDMDVAGEYTITYTATDSSNNKTTATRTVIVKSADVVWNVSSVTEFRQALEDASANGEHDRIVLSAGTYKTTSDGLGTFTFNDNEAFDLTIESAEGLTYQDVILDGDETHQVFKFDNTQESTLIFKGVSVIDGNSSSGGGGIYSSKNIDIKDCKISNNSATSGGGFYSNGSTTMTNSTISNNNSIASYSSGAGFYSGGTTTITNSIISYNIGDSNYFNGSNSGGGFSSNGSTTVINSTISHNSAQNSGGGFSSGGTTNIINSIISDNIARHHSPLSDDGGGGFSSRGTTITDSTISNNSSAYNGGGFLSSETVITNSIISNNNSQRSGGGFYSSWGRTTITNSNISNNSASYRGGGFKSPSATVINSIFNENNATTGATFYSDSSYTYISNNTFVKNRGSIDAKGIFVNNIFSENDEDIFLRGASKIYNNYIDYNKIEDNGHNVIKKQNLQPSSIGDVHLNSDNKTLASNSPVIDKGLNPSSATFKQIIDNDDIYNQMVELLKTDMVGNNRVHNGTVDMGAVEFGSN